MVHVNYSISFLSVFSQQQSLFFISAFSMDHFDEYEKHFTVMTARKYADTHEVS